MPGQSWLRAGCALISLISVQLVECFTAPPAAALRLRSPAPSSCFFPVPLRDGRVEMLAHDSSKGVTTEADFSDCDPTQREVLSCTIKGYYPFPQGVQGPIAWLFRDTHQAISITSSVGSGSARMDFMTEGGQAHPVWWNEEAKWQVLLGQNIKGEVRVRIYGEESAKMQRLLKIARSYDNRMNLYTNNCRIFCARMRREVERLNAEDADTGSTTAELVADLKLLSAVTAAAALPMLYPAAILWVCWEAVRDL